MSERCNRCGSYAINERLHGRQKGRWLELCDVCYWRAEHDKCQRLLREACNLARNEAANEMWWDADAIPNQWFNQAKKAGGDV